MDKELYTYRAAPVRVIDGDTIEVDIDLGFRVMIRQRLRLLGINTPELHDKNIELRKRATDARLFTIGWISKAMSTQWPIIIKTAKSDKYGRWLAEIYYGDECLNTLLIEKGLADPYIV